MKTADLFQHLNYLITELTLLQSKEVNNSFASSYSSSDNHILGNLKENLSVGETLPLHEVIYITLDKGKTNKQKTNYSILYVENKGKKKLMAYTLLVFNSNTSNPSFSFQFHESNKAKFTLESRTIISFCSALH